MKFSRILIAVLACSSFLFAQEASLAKPAKAKKIAGSIIKGTVISVDAIANLIVVKVKKIDDTVSVESSTKIMSGKKDIAIGDIKTDSKVTVIFKTLDGKKMATKIIEMAQKPESKAAAK
jgi:small nuclear ribonucleoprotein (snRNP)-like protein